MAKRTKKSTSSSREEASRASRPRKIGKLKCLLDMPLDVFYEIVFHLTPLDLLQLSRVSKQFRKEFMTRRKKHLWATVRQKNFPDLPECPLELQEPQYANLLFEHNCMGCGHSPSKMLDWALFRRYCKKCYDSHVKKGSTLSRSYAKNIDVVVYTLLPPSCVYNEWCDDGIPDCLSNRPDQLYDRADFDKVIRHYLSVENDKDSRLQFIHERRKYVGERMARSFAIATWQEELRDSREDEDEEKTKRRRESIQHKLKEAGYEEDVWPSVSGRRAHLDHWNRLLDQPRELTPRIWKQIFPKLTAIIEQVALARAELDKIRRLDLREKGLIALYRRFLASIDPGTAAMMPALNDVYWLPSMRALLWEDDATVTEEQWMSIRNQFLEDAKKHEQHIRDLYLSLAKVNTGTRYKSRADNQYTIQRREGRGDYESFLSSLRAIFVCGEKNCHGLLRFPDNRLHYHTRDGVPMPRLSCFLDIGLDHGLKQDSFTYDEEIVDIALHVLEILGLPKDSPQTVLDSLRGRLECLCGKARVSQPMSFGLLVSVPDVIPHVVPTHEILEVHHIYAENRWYNAVQDYVGRSPESPDAQTTAAMYCNDHDLTSTSPFFILRDEVTEGPIAPLPCRETGYVCGICPDSVMYHAPSEAEEDVEHHILTKHLKDVEEGDIFKRRYWN
ncbi:hypothetical protein NEOLEDRAFT_694464 [Neolentinus lepideus HHB14362 ss-1]|uniref:F-box domain-containing protein n=1 Tax=Neolentinus lepideus HHB14362 ss-1 TaxID=1314782 RepID=A0A165V278_9AGAM|nr:hypothetical protein NEOLEDRAFT_694464 [Neolentinus lepideus HHB14362 ss-1]